MDSPGSFFSGGIISDEDPAASTAPPGGAGLAMEDKEEPVCPPGLRQYETMVVLRPDMSEDERLSLTQKYEEVSISVCLLRELTGRKARTMRKESKI